MREKVLVIKADEDCPGQFIVLIPELNLMFPTHSAKRGFDRAVEEVGNYGIASAAIDDEIAEIDKAISILEKKREALEASKRDQLKVSAILKESEQKRYRSAIRVLYEDTGIEKVMNGSVVAVAFVPVSEGSISGLSLTWMWYFNRYFE